MNEIMKQVAIAKRRMMALHFLQSLAKGLLVTFAIAAVILTIPKLWPLSIDTRKASLMALAMAAGASLLGATIRTFFRRPTSLDAATEIDLRLKLRERLSSSLQLDEQDRNSAVGQALVQDAIRASSRMDLRDAFPLKLDRVYFGCLIPMILSALLFLVPDATAPEVVAKGLSPENLTQVKSSAKDLMEMVRKQREQAEEEGMDEAADFFKQIQSKIEELQKSNTTDTKKILSDLNQLKEAMQKRRDELGSSESLKKNLASLNSLEKGPAEKLAKAMQDGEFEEASDELQKMMEGMESGELSPEQKEKLSKQMEKMADALADAAAEHEEAKQALEQQIADAEKAGDVERVAEMREKLAKMQAQDDDMDQLAEMAAQMKAAAEGLKQGDQASVQKALEKMKQQMDKMGADAKQLRDLEKLMDGANECKKCANGQCEGSGKDGKPQWKPGKGEGPGGGERQEEGTETRHIESQVRTDMQQGETIYGGKTGGLNRKGVSRADVQQAILSAEVEEAEALENIPLPKKQREHSREYFESLRKGK